MDILAGYWLCIQTFFGQKCLVSQGMRNWYHRVDWYVLVVGWVGWGGGVESTAYGKFDFFRF